MDERRFDDLARALAGVRSRRSVVRALGGGVAGLVAGVLAPRSSLAACGNRPRCPQGWTCIDDTCCHPSRACGSTCCPAGSRRVDGQCTSNGCPAGQQRCGGSCLDLSADPQNCGACGNVCPTEPCRSRVCQGGVCSTVPDPSQDGEPCPNGTCQGGACQEGCIPTKTSCEPNECGVFSNGCSGFVDCGEFCCPQGCPEGQACDRSTGRCVDQICCNGSATCCHYTTEGLCCVTPNVAVACCDSAPGAGDGWLMCCEVGVDCPPCASSSVVIGGSAQPACSFPTGDSFAGCEF